MAVTLRAAGTSATGTTSVAVSSPASAVTGDYLLAFIVDHATSGTTTAPTGWTRIGGAAGTGGRFQVFSATVGLGGLTGTSWTWSSLTSRSQGVICAFTGQWSTPLDGTLTARVNASGTTGTTSLTTTTNNSLIVGAFAAMASGSTWSGEITATAGALTEIFDAPYSGFCSIAVATAQLNTPGATGASSATMGTAGANRGILLAIRPVPVPAVVAVTTTLPVPAVVVSHGATVTPATVATSTDQPVPAVSTPAGGTLTAPTLAGTPATVTSTTWHSAAMAVTLTPAAGDILVIKVVSGDSATTALTPVLTGGNTPVPSLRASDATSSYCAVYVWTTAAMTSATSTTVTCTHSGGSDDVAMMVVERWAGAALAATPATNSTKTGSGAPSATLTSVQDKSVVTWCSGDWSAVAGTPAYLSSAVQTGTRAGDGLYYAAYFAYQAADTHGTQTMGLSAPTGEKWNLVGIEVEGTLSAGGSATVAAATLAVTTARPAPTVTTGNVLINASVLAAAAAQPLVTASGNVIAPTGTPAGGPYTLAWQEEFAYPDGTGNPNRALWSDRLIEGDYFRCNDGGSEIAWYTHSNIGISVTSGILSLTAVQQSPYTADPLCPSPLPGGQTGTYTSGMIQSHPGFQFTYGYYEARLKLPTDIPGAFPAAWLLGADGYWPPEIDIAEVTSQTYTNQYYQDDNSIRQVDHQVGLSDWASPGWHTYGVAWLPGSMTFYFDGAQTATYSGTTTAYPLHVILNNAVVSGCSSTGFALQAEYLRYWQFTGVPAQPAITSVTPDTGVPSAGTLQVSFGAVGGATSYRVTTCPVDGDADSWTWEHNNATGAGSPVTVSGLQNGVRYTATVAAVNGTGYSLESLPWPKLPGTPAAAATLAAATAQPAATVTVTSSATTAPATLAVATIRPAVTVTVTGSATATPATLAVATAQPQIIRSVTVTPAVLAAATAQPAVTVTIPVLASALAVTTAQPVPAVGTTPLPAGNPSGGPWVLSFDEEWADPYSTGKPDWTVWADHFIEGDAFRCNDSGDEIQWVPHNHSGEVVSGGVASLIATSRGSLAAVQAIDPLAPSTLPGGSHAPTYTSGILQSHPGFQQTYGYFEARIKFPATSVTGAWPAFWMYAADAQWPPESDIAEYTSPSATWWPESGANTTRSLSVADATQWHVYGMRWTATQVTYFVDGTAVGSAISTGGTSLPMHIAFDLYVQPSATGTGFPCQVDIDYVRAWTTTGVPAQPAITSVTPATGVPSAGSVQVAFGAVSGATSYRATACPVDKNADGGPATRQFQAGGSSPLTVTGLTNGARYTVTVAAVNATGYSTESLPAPAGMLNANALALPAALTAATSQPAATVSTATGATVSAATLAVATAAPAVTVSTTSSATAAPGVKAVTTAQPAATVTTASNATAAPGVVAAASAQPAVTVTAGTGAAAAPGTLAVTSSAPLPVVRQDQNPAPAVKSVTTTIPAPAVTAGGSATTAPATLAVTTAQPAPVVRQDQAITATGPAAASTAPVPAVTVTSSATAAPVTLAAATAQPQATVTTAAGATVTPATVAATATQPPPAVSAGGSASAAPGTLAVTVTIGVPQVRQDRTLIPAAVAVTVTIPAPAASGNASLAPATLTVLAAFPARTVSTGMTAAPSVVAVSVDIPQATRPATFGIATPGGAALTLATAGGAALTSATPGGQP